MQSERNARYDESMICYYGWIIVGISFLANMVGFGLVYSYGVFFKSLASEFGWSRSVISGAFSTYAILHNIMAFFAGRLVDRVGPKLVMGIAGFSLGLSMMVMSHINSLVGLYFFYGVIFSIGIAATYSPSMATVSRWFKPKRGLAVGLATAGLGAGSFIFSPLSAWLISSLGWRNSYTVLGIIAWTIFIPIVLFMRKPPPDFENLKSRSESLGGLSFSEAFRTKTFWSYGFSVLFIGGVLWAIMVHIVPLATDRGIHITTAGIIAGIIGGSSIVARISAGVISDKIGRKKIFISAFGLELAVTIWLFFASEFWMLLIFAIIFGLGSGGWAGVMPAFAADYFGYKATGAIIGFAVIMAGVGVALASFLGGYIFDVTGSYDYMVVLFIIATIAAIIFALFMRPLKL